MSFKVRTANFLAVFQTNARALVLTNISFSVYSHTAHIFTSHPVFNLIV